MAGITVTTGPNQGADLTAAGTLPEEDADGDGLSLAEAIAPAQGGDVVRFAATLPGGAGGTLAG